MNRVPSHLPVTLTVDDPDGAKFVATAEISAMGELLLTGDTDLLEIETMTSGEYRVNWLENALRDEGAKAWAVWAEKNGDER